MDPRHFDVTGAKNSDCDWPWEKLKQKSLPERVRTMEDVEMNHVKSKVFEIVQYSFQCIVNNK